jgi:hypothetical protein
MPEIKYDPSGLTTVVPTRTPSEYSARVEPGTPVPVTVPMLPLMLEEETVSPLIELDMELDIELVLYEIDEDIPQVDGLFWATERETGP